jgi:hypothetical protein
LDTGNAILTHTQDKGKWGKEFPRILMEVREQLMNDKINSSSISKLAELGKQRKNECNG